MKLVPTLFLFAGGLAGAAGVFHPGAVWPDDRGTHINAHGGGVLSHAGVYY
jgi:hypothetical protein